MTEILRKFIHMLYRFTPKWNYAVVWGWPDYEDNVISLEKGLQDSKVGRVFVLLSDPSSPPPYGLGHKTSALRKNSPKGWLVFCFARYVFFTHRCFMKHFPPNVVAVNVWHGMPIKRIGWMLEGDEGISSSYTLATSPFWAEIMGRSMRSDLGVLPLGLPRNDRLFSQRSEVMKKLGIACEKRLIAWLPTYRKSIRGDLRTDGLEFGNVFEMPGLEADELNEFLKIHNTILLVKPHPMAAFGEVREHSNLLIVDDRWLRARSLSLYEFLGATDLLVSDISSVVIDYLLLDRPVIHAFPDLAEYRDSRGFTVEPIEDFLVGPIIGNPQELFDALEIVLSGQDPEASKRRKVAQLSHSHMDKDSTSRLLKELGLR